MTYVELMVAQSEVIDDILSQISMDALIKAQATDVFCKHIRQSMDMDEKMTLDDNPDTRVVERTEIHGSAEP